VKYRFSELMDMDDMLFQLASYEASEGLVPLLTTQEDVLAFKMKSSKIFNEYKLGIQRGSFDLHYIKNRVSKFGPILAKYNSEDEVIDDMFNGADTDIIENESIERAQSFEDLLKKYEQAAAEMTQVGKDGIDSLVDMLDSWRDSEKEEILPLDELPLDDVDGDGDETA
jgi:hypothetical protein